MWRPAARTIVRGVLRCALGYWAAAVLATATGSQTSAADPPTSAERQAIMRLVAENWRETQGPDGFLPYGFDFLEDRATDHPMSAGYIVREAGTFHVWAKYYRFSGDDRYRDSLRRGIAAFGKRSIPIGKSRTQEWLEATRMLSVPAGRLTLRAALEKFGLLYRPRGAGKLVSADGQYSGTWAGATAFALLAELTYWQASGDNRFAELRSAWRDGLLALRIPGRGFRESATSIDESDYDTGEAWLALAVYADLHRDDRQLRQALADIDRTLVKRYTEDHSTWFYSWGAMAAAQRWRTTADPIFLHFLTRQAEFFVVRFEQQPGMDDDNNCGQMEGLATALGVMTESGDGGSNLALRVRAHLSREATKFQRLQIPPGRTQLTLGGRSYLVAPSLARFGGAFRSGLFEPVTRIDAAAHCLSALMLMDEAVRARPGTVPAPIKQ